MREKYQSLIEIHQQAQRQKEQKFTYMGTAKLILIFLLVALFWFGFHNGFTPTRGMQIIFITVAGAALWVYHHWIDGQIDYHKEMIRLLSRYIARIDGTWTDFSDNGGEFNDKQHAYANDLDIFGVNSLFQFLNTSQTYHGRQQFMLDLSRPAYSPQDILARQAAVRELAEKEEFNLEYQYWGTKIGLQQEIPQLLSELELPDSYLKSRKLSLLLHYMPVLTAPFSCGVFIFGLTLFYPAAVALLTLQAAIWIALSFKSHKTLSYTSRAQRTIGKYAKLYSLVEAQSFESKLLQNMQRKVCFDKTSAAAGVKELDRIISKIEVRRNGLIWFVLNILLLWDIECAFRLQQWKNRYASHIKGWFESLGVLESLFSFSVLENVTSGITYPVPIQAKKQMHAQKLGHPLIPEDKRICNDFDFNGQIIIVSGSNMSGKTTFLRTVGINIVLAKCGAGVCADTMAFSEFTLITSMRIVDDLNEGISTFYAELKKIKAILDLAATTQDTLFFIDEIFRGTNSDDRLAGARAVINKLGQLKVCGFLTTHDLSLCQHTKGVSVENFHFSEQYKNGELYFDYTIKPGIASSTNGQYLMKMLDIID